MPKPKVIVFTTAYYPFIGGAEIAIQEVAKRLKDRFDFYIVTARFRRDLPRREVRLEGTVIRVGFGTILDKWLLLLFGPIKCATLGVAQGGTTLWGVDIGQGALGAAILKLFFPRTHFIFTIQYGYGTKRIAKGRWGMIGLALRFLLGRADRVTAISRHLKEMAYQYGYRGRVTVIPNGVDIQKLQNTNYQLPTIPKTQKSKIKTVITTSRLVPKNGIDILIRAIAEVKKTVSDIQCHIIGDGPEKNNYQLLVTSYGLQENVKFFGTVRHEEIPKYLHEADVFVRPSRSEGMGSSFVEALAAGLPIIGTPVGGITDIIKDGQTGLFCRVDDSRDLAGKIITLLGNISLMKRIVKEGRQMVEEKFSWDGLAETYAAVFETLPLRIVISTPLYPPQVGGPAFYAKTLGEEFTRLGHRVTTLSFGNFLRYPSGLRHLFYLITLLAKSWRAEVLFSLDYFSAGAPAALVARFLRKPLVVRCEGDFLWEHFVERTRKDITLPDFYQISPLLSRKEKLIRAVSGWALKQAALVVFSSEWRRRMVVDAYGLSSKKTRIIKNIWSPATGSQLPVTSNRRIILWAGRMLYLKNLYRLVRAFNKANRSGKYVLHLIGDGPEKERIVEYVKKEKLKHVKFFNPLPRAKLLEKFSRAACLVLPSLSEVGPNVIAEALSVRTPFIMTSQSGYIEYIKGSGPLINPLSEEGLKKALEDMMNDVKSNRQRKKAVSFGFSHSAGEAAKEWITLFKNL